MDKSQKINIVTRSLVESKISHEKKKKKNETNVFFLYGHLLCN